MGCLLLFLIDALVLTLECALVHLRFPPSLTGSSSAISDTSRSTISQKEQKQRATWTLLWLHQMLLLGCFYVASWSTLRLPDVPLQSIPWSTEVALLLPAQLSCALQSCVLRHIAHTKARHFPHPDQCSFIHDLTKEQNTSLCST